MQRFSTLVGSITAIVTAVLFIVKDVIAPVVVDFIKKQPETDDAIHAILKFVLDLLQQPWLHVAGWMLVGFVAGLWLDGLLRKLDYTRVEKRKALGAEMAKLGNYLGQISLNSLSLRKKMRGLCHALPLLRSSGYGRLMVEHSHFRPLVPGA